VETLRVTSVSTINNDLIPLSELDLEGLEGVEGVYVGRHYFDGAETSGAVRRVVIERR